jgi:superfamily II DNA or RNA helicase
MIKGSKRLDAGNDRRNLIRIRLTMKDGRFLFSWRESKLEDLITNRVITYQSLSTITRSKLISFIIVGLKQSTEPFLFIWDKWFHHLTISDFTNLIFAQDIIYENTSPLWWLAKSVSQSKISQPFQLFWERFKDKLTVADLKLQPKDDMNVLQFILKGYELNLINASVMDYIFKNIRDIFSIKFNFPIFPPTIWGKNMEALCQARLSLYQELERLKQNPEDHNLELLQDLAQKAKNLGYIYADKDFEDFIFSKLDLSFITSDNDLIQAIDSTDIDSNEGAQNVDSNSILEMMLEQTEPEKSIDLMELVEPIDELIEPEGAIDYKYLDGRLPVLPHRKSDKKVELVSPTATYRLEFINTLQCNKNNPFLRRFDTAFFKADYYSTEKSPISENEQVTFVCAGRKENALIPSLDKGRCILVLTQEEYSDETFKAKIPTNIDVLVIKQLSSESHGDYTNLKSITCRRLGIFLFAYIEGVSSFLMLDDNISQIKLPAEELTEAKWSQVYNYIYNSLTQMQQACVSVRTESPKIRLPGELGSKMFMVNMDIIKERLSRPRDMFIPFPNAAQASRWGEDYYMQLVLFQLFSNRGYQILGNDICLVRSKKYRNAFAKSGVKAVHYDQLPNDYQQKLDPELAAVIENTILQINVIINNNQIRYQRQIDNIVNANLFKIHANANQIKSTSRSPFNIPIEDLNFYTKFSYILDKIELTKFFRPYQQMAIKCLLENDKTCLSLRLPTASGKTRVQQQWLQIGYHALNPGQFVVAVTPHIDLVNQYYEDMIRFNEQNGISNIDLRIPSKDIIKISSDIKSVSVAAIFFNKKIDQQRGIFIFCLDSFKKLIDENPDFLKRLPFIVFDEYHYEPKSLHSLVTKILDINELEDKLVVGLTATPPADDILGPPIFTQNRAELIKDRYLAPIIADSLGKEYSTANEANLIACLPAILRNQYHPGFLKATKLKDLKGIAYFTSIKNCNDAVEELKKARFEGKVFAIHSSNKRFKAELESFLKSDEPGILIAVEKLRFGFDLPAAAYIIDGQMANPKEPASISGVEQKIGRVMRLYGDKIGYWLGFDDVLKKVVEPLLKDQQVTFPISPEYLAQKLCFYYRDGECKVIDSKDPNNKEKISKRFVFKIQPKIIPEESFSIVLDQPSVPPTEEPEDMEIDEPIDEEKWLSELLTNNKEVVSQYKYLNSFYDTVIKKANPKKRSFDEQDTFRLGFRTDIENPTELMSLISKRKGKPKRL